MTISSGAFPELQRLNNSDNYKAMDDPHVYQQLGQLQAQVKTLEERTSSMDGKLDEILASNHHARGQRSMLWKVGTVSSALGALAFSAVQAAASFFHKGP